MYRSEASFSQALCRQLTAISVFHQRIESGETGRGIPDLCIFWLTGEMWVELKRDPRLSIKDPSWQIRWRKGQQAWMLKYRRASNKLAYTVAVLSDGFIIIPMNKRYVHNVVYATDVITASKLTEVISILKKQTKK